MKKNSKIIAIVAVLLLLIAGGLGLYYVNSQKTADTVQKPQTTSSDEKITFSNNGKEVSYVGQDGKTALDALKSLTSVDTKESAYGTMVAGIHGVKAEDGKSYWAFYVNGAYANEGAGTFKTKAADRITWKLEVITQ